MFLNGQQRRAIHSQMSCLRKHLIKTLDMNLQRHRPNMGSKVEEGVGSSTNPRPYVPSVGKRGGESNDTDFVIKLRGDVPRSRDHRLQHMPVRTPQQMHFISDEKIHILHSLSHLPPTGKAIPVLGRGNHNSSHIQQLQIHCRLSCQKHDLMSQIRLKLLPPIHESLLTQRIVRDNIHTPGLGFVLRSLLQHPQNRKLRHDSLPTSGRSTDKRVFISRIKSMEYLRLNRVKKFKIVIHRLELRVLEGLHREGLQV
mmetsp:Transcript_117/g.251  ORF Transcript_117/g.251 Transcript_117/m.251 type:complete len:255 (-) Transcript_117:546-1310(-)